jgi:two-component system LytT family response regulator
MQHIYNPYHMEKSTSVFIVDDEYQSRLVLAKMLPHYFPEVKVLGEAATVAEAVAGIKRWKPQVLFLDVQMNGETGFEVLDKLEGEGFEVIFTTAYQEYAARAFRYSAIDYLIKPIDPSELEMATQKAIDRISLQPSCADAPVRAEGQPTAGPKNIPKIGVPTPDGLLFIGVDDIIYCQGQGNYTEIFLLNGQKITSSHTLRSYEGMLADRQFFRTHKSFLINLRHIESYRKGEGGNVLMTNGREIEVARRNKAGFLNLFKG